MKYRIEQILMRPFEDYDLGKKRKIIHILSATGRKMYSMPNANYEVWALIEEESE